MSKSGDMPPPYNPAEPSPYPVGQPASYPGQPASYPGQPAPYQGQPAPYPSQPAPYQSKPGQNGQPMPQGYQTSQTNVVVHQPRPITTAAAPPDHMTSAIFVTLCCFLPTGIFAIMRANDAKNAAMRGDMVAANTNARSAKTMINISIIAGICSAIVLVVMISLGDSYYDIIYY